MGGIGWSNAEGQTSSSPGQQHGLIPQVSATAWQHLVSSQVTRSVRYGNGGGNNGEEGAADGGGESTTVVAVLRLRNDTMAAGFEVAYKFFFLGVCGLMRGSGSCVRRCRRVAAVRQTFLRIWIF